MSQLPTLSNYQLPKSPNKGNYKQIWEALKANTVKKIVVRCPVSHMETLIQAVKKIKSTENANRKRLDDDSAPHFGRLVVDKNIEQGTVTFSLTYAVQDLI